MREGQDTSIFVVWVANGLEPKVGEYGSCLFLVDPPGQMSDLIALTGPVTSFDGRHMAFPAVQKDGTVAVVVLSPETGAQEAQFEIPPTLDTAGHTVAWTPNNFSIAISDRRSGVPNLWALPIFVKGKPEQLTHFTAGTIWNFQWSPDGNKLAIARGSNDSDVVLLTKTR